MIKAEKIKIKCIMNKKKKFFLNFSNRNKFEFFFIQIKNFLIFHV